MEIRAKTIGEGLEKLVKKVDEVGVERKAPRWHVKEVAPAVTIIEKPTKDFDDSFPFWSLEQDVWYQDNFVRDADWMEISKEMQTDKKKASSYCYYLRYHKNDGGLTEINQVLTGIDRIIYKQDFSRTFKELYARLEQEGIIADVSFSVLTWLKEAAPNVFKNITGVMKKKHSYDVPRFSLCHEDGIIDPKNPESLTMKVIDELKKNQNSNRAYISGIYNLTDVAGRVGRPPFSAYQAAIRDGKVISTVYMRANDVIWGAQLDIHHGYIFAEEIATELDLDIGQITLFSNLAHRPVDYGDIDEVKQGGVQKMKDWLFFVTSTKPAEDYPEL